jgi:hypothetical protein
LFPHIILHYVWTLLLIPRIVDENDYRYYLFPHIILHYVWTLLLIPRKIWRCGNFILFLHKIWQFGAFLKGQPLEKVGEMREEGDSLGPN